MAAGRILQVVLLVLLGLWALGGAPRAGAAEEEHQRQLSKARFQEVTEGDFEQALELYDALLLEEGLDDATRGSALLGRSRCLMQLDRTEEAVRIWEEIAADDDLPVDVQDQAKSLLDAYLAERGKRDQETMKQDAVRELLERRRRKARDHLEQARRAFEEGQLERARSLLMTAKSILPDYPEADELLDQVAQAMPDQGELLRQLLRFADTTHARELRRLKEEIERLQKEGRERFDADDLEGAAERFREAIARIDGSDDFAKLLNEREQTLGWLRKTLMEADARGVDLGDEPPTPDPFQIAPDWRRDLHGLLGRMFSDGEGEEDPLIVYEVRPALLPLDAPSASLAPGPFPPGMTATRRGSTLSRAWWAERWIRGNVGTGWDEGDGPDGRPRVLDRFGDVLLVQNNLAAHRKVRSLLDGFSPIATPVVVDLAVVASTTAGGVQLSTQLGLAASPRDSGLELVASNRLFAESLAAVNAFEGLELLGTARLKLTGEPRAQVVISQRSEDHPVYDGLPNPPLVLTEADSRYGVFLDVIAEDLVNAEGTRRAAIGVVARTRIPCGTVVVHRPASRLGYERLAQPMAEQRVEGVEILPHAGTLVVQGVSNPFPQTAEQWPGLILLFAVRPADDGTGRVPMADPQRTPAIANGGAAGGPEEREYLLGALASEVEDAVMVEGWPRRPLLEPVSPTAARRARERYLESQLGGPWSGIAQPGETSPVTVRGDVATASLPNEAHDRLAKAVERLRGASTALYEVDVLATEVAEETLADWMREGGVVAFTPGTYLVTSPEGERALDARMRELGGGPALYALQSRLLARATQKVAAHNLRAQRIVQDLRFWRHTDGTLRYIPVSGLAEEGIAVMVRPELDAAGRRLVTVEAQAARLREMERLSLPDVEVDGGLITVARHHPVQSRRAAAPLGEGEAVLLTLPTPEGSGRVILVKVTVRRLQ